MSRISINRSFVIGMLAGCTSTILVTSVWLLPSVSFKKHGELMFKDFPKGINTVTFKNDLVDLAVMDFTYERDVPFEINFIAECKDRKYGSMWGSPHEGQFYFEYKNVNRGIYSSPPINDIDGSHPTTKIQKAQQDAP